MLSDFQVLTYVILTLNAVLTLIPHFANEKLNVVVAQNKGHTASIQDTKDCNPSLTPKIMLLISELQDFLQ